MMIDRDVPHGGASTRYRGEYGVWQQMGARCHDPERKDYPRYGGRGVTVCWEWRVSFLRFLNDIGPRPSAKHTLDRIDNNGRYEPANCRWELAKPQARNRRNNNLLTYRGETRCLSEWAEVLGIPRNTIEGRLRLGWDAEAILSTPPQQGSTHRRRVENMTIPITCGGESRTFHEWSAFLELHPKTLARRLSRGWTLERALSERLHANMRRRSRG